MLLSEAFKCYELEELRFRERSEKTIGNYRGVLASFLKANSDIPVQLLTLEHLIRWKMRMDYEGNQISYMAHNLMRMRKVLKYLRKRGLSVLDPEEIELPRVARKKVEFLYSHEVQAMIDAAELPRDKALIALGFASGGRISEILSLNRDSIRDGEATIIGKGDKPGTLSFDSTALRYLDEYLATRRDKLRPLFVSSQNRRLGYARANQIYHRVADYAGIEINVTTHTMRHSFATDMLLNGANIVEVKEHLRHEDISTTLRYLHVTDEHKKASYKKYHSKLK
jgi:integrase/recombinase XerD